MTQKFLCMDDKAKKDCVVVFDLDDTLYAEYDYQTSGIKAVAMEIFDLYGRNIVEELLQWRSQGERDIWGRACRLLGLPESLKDSLLWIYRLHKPDIVLDDGTLREIKKLGAAMKKVVILTDGRSVSQRKKIEALGLSDLPVYISEEYQSEKPGHARFYTIMRDYPAARYFYIGDNPVKDFIAPNALGWFTVGLRGGEHNIHSQCIDGLHQSAFPREWIDSIYCLSDILMDSD